MAVAHKPPESIVIPDTQELFFFGGPIQGAPDWQSEAYDITNEIADDSVHIAIPRRGEINEEFSYTQQVNWEKAGLRRAAILGGALFYFAAQDHGLDYEPGRAYAQTSRIELGRYIGWRDYNPLVHLSIGIEPGYKGNEKYIRDCAEEVNLRVFSNIEDTCAALIEEQYGEF